MIFWVGDGLVPAAEARVSVLDRSFLYGDGLFETAPVRGGFVFRWRLHLERLAASAKALGIGLPGGLAGVDAAAAAVLRANTLTDGVLRVHLSRGVGPRGYSPEGAHAPLLTVTVHPPGPPPGPRRLVVVSWRVAVGDALGAHKTSSQLGRVAARAEASARGGDEAVILNTLGKIAEAASANLLWIEGDRLIAPPLSAGGLPGVTRAAAFSLATAAGLDTEERSAGPEALLAADAVLTTSSSYGLAPAASLDGRPLRRAPAGDRLIAAYNAAWAADREAPGALAAAGV